MATTSNVPVAGARWLALSSMAALGVAAVVTQLVLLREMLAVFEGNEMVFGILLGNWLLLSGMGAWLGRTTRNLDRPWRTLTVSQILIAVLPLAQLASLRGLRNIVFTRGAMVGVAETTLASAVVLAPFCVLSGYMLALGCSILSHETEDAGEIGRVYVADSIGSIAGGVLFSFLLVWWLDHASALCVPAALNLALAVVMGCRCRMRTVAVTAGVLMAALAFAGKLDALTTQWQHAPHKVVFHGNSPYGRLVVTEASGQLNFIENGVPLFSTHNVEQVEETVHYAMAQRPEARRVLLIGGGVTGTAREILKYGVAEVTYVELDPQIPAVARRFAPEALADGRITVINGDGRLFVRETPARFDVAIVDVPEPGTSQLNRFYTSEFYGELKRALAPGGVVAFALGRYENYASRELEKLLSSARQTLQETFKRTLLLPGGRVFVLASDGPLTKEIASRVAGREIGVKLMTRNYLDAMLTPDRLMAVERASKEEASVNRDFSPALYRYHLRYWLSRAPGATGVLAGLLVVLGLFFPLLLRGGALAVYAGGFAASALEVVLLLGFQILCGSVYHQVGVVVTAFMAGLAAGAWWVNRSTVQLSRWTLPVLAAGIGLFALLLPAALTQLGGMSFAAVRVLVTAMTFGLAVLVGMEFPVAARVMGMEVTKTAAGLYGADFVGACIGALLASTLLIPLAGVWPVCWLTAGLNGLAALSAWWRGRKQ